jgi:hypothetical protein
MAASSTKGVSVCMTKTAAVGKTLTVTAVSKAKPAVVTAAAHGLVAGDIVVFPASATGIAEVDGKSFVVGAPIDATTFTLLGADTTGATGTFAAGANKPTAYATADMECLCWSSLGFNPESPSTISVATFCDPSAQIASSTTGAGTVDFGGYVDITSPDYIAIVAAEADGKAHEFRITLPNNGYILFKGTVSSLNIDVPLEGAVAYSGQITLTSKPRHIF